jgi:hypothetical protein
MALVLLLPLIHAGQLGFKGGKKHSALSIQSAQQFGAVSTGILPSKVAVMETKTLNHRGRRGAQRKTLLLQICTDEHRF